MTQHDLDQISSWIERNARGKSGESLLQVFERLTHTIWQAANASISSVGLQIIFDRAVEYTAGSYFLITLLKVDEQGIHFEELRARAPSLADYDIVEGFRTLVTKFISLLRLVTPGFVIPALYGDLATLGIPVPDLIREEDSLRVSNIPISRINSGVRNLDSLLNGGIPRGSLVVFGGSPGSGKTILSQEIGFHYAQSES